MLDLIGCPVNLAFTGLSSQKNLNFSATQASTGRTPRT